MNIMHTISGLYASNPTATTVGAGVVAFILAWVLGVVLVNRGRYIMQRKQHPNFREYLNSSKLQRHIDSGAVGRGRVEATKPPPSWRAPWLEFCLRMRILGAALSGVVMTGSAQAGLSTPVGRLYIKHTKADGTVIDHGLVSTKVVTTAGVNYIVDALQALATIENMRYHAIGTGNTAEAVGDTALVTEVESRATGTRTEGASANIYRSVGEITTGSARAVVEHGLFSASTGGTLLDRSVFAVINTGAGDSIEFTYELTVPAGS